MIEVKDLSKAFRSTMALDHIHVTIGNGVTGILGPNGAGKTTFLRYITAIYPDRTDAIRWKGVPIRKQRDYKSQVGYLPQHFGLFPHMKVQDAFRLMAELKRIPAVQQEKAIHRCLAEVDLEDKAQRKVGQLSGGMIRRLGIAQAFLGDPAICLFDEPTAGLDPEERLRFKNLLARPKDEVLYLISTHIVEDVEAICDHILVMNRGRILFSGTQNELAGMAKNRVYEEESERLDETKAGHIIRRQNRGGVSVTRCLSEEKIGVPVHPTIEDGYLYLILQDNPQ